jgi:hypothetical protein
MSTHFLYRPHVSADGMIVTPDLALARLTVDLDGHAHALPVQRLATDAIVQSVGAAARPAIAFVAGSYGTIVAPACVLLPSSGDPRAADIALSRQATRLAAAAGALTVGWAEAAQIAVAPIGEFPYGAIGIVVAGPSRPLAGGTLSVRMAAGAFAVEHRFEAERVEAA